MFSEFTGQVKVCERLEVLVEAAKKRGDVLEQSCSAVRRVSGKRRSPTSSRTRWA